MPRAVVKLSPAREPPPDWWADEFHARQARLRPRVLKHLADCAKPITLVEMTWQIGGYTRRELGHLLDLLESEGLVRRFDRTEHFSYACSKPVTRVYYELTEG